MTGEQAPAGAFGATNDDGMKVEKCDGGDGAKASPVGRLVLPK